MTLLALTVGAALALNGCAALALPMLAPLLGAGTSGAVKAGAEYSQNGTVYRTFSAPFDQVRDGMVTTFERLDVKLIEEKRHDNGSVTIRGVAYDRRVTMVLEPVTPRMTRVRIAVNKGWGRDAATASEIVAQAEAIVEPEATARTARR